MPRLSAFKYIIIAAICLTGMQCALAEEIPIDSAVRFGTLPNGMTYYVRHCPEPPQQAELWLVHRVGSICENDNQQGYAHFLEHMAFNDTQSFPGHTIVDYLMANGVRYGRDINATTSYDQTCYQFSRVPTTRASLLDTLSLMLRDLSGSLLLNPDDIEKEKRIIEQEWLHTETPATRLLANILPQLLPCSPYANRMPIGNIDTVRAITPQSLTRFYHQWYQPHRQAIVAVGDFDADMMVQRLQRTFNATATTTTATLLDDRPGDRCNNFGARYAAFTDIEASAAIAYLFFRHHNTPPQQRNTTQYLHEFVVSHLAQEMLGRRLQECTKNPDDGVQYVTCSDGPMLSARNHNAFYLTATALSTDHAANALNTLAREVVRAAVYGFDANELTIAKRALNAIFDSYGANADKQTSREYADEYIDHFLNGGYIPGVIEECRLSTDAIASTTLQQTNDYIRNIIVADSAQILFTTPQALPADFDQTANNILRNAFANPTAPDTDTTNNINTPLLAHQPDYSDAAIISRNTDTTTGITRFKLSNGVNVVVQPTDFQNDEVNLSAVAPGGLWAFNGNYAPELKAMDLVIENSKIGGFTDSQLNSMLAGKQVGTYFVVNEDHEELQGQSSCADLTTLLQLCHLYFTDITADTTAFAALKQRLHVQAEQIEANPEIHLADTIMDAVYGSNNNIYRRLSPHDIDALNYDDILALYHNRTAAANAYTFCFTGNINPDSIAPLLVQYLATLPSHTEHIHYTPANYVTPGVDTRKFALPMANDRASVYAIFAGNIDSVSTRQYVLAQLLEHTISAGLNYTLREQLHATYGVEADVVVNRHTRQWTISYKFDCLPDDVDSLNNEAENVINQVIAYGPSQEFFDQAKATLLRDYNEQKRNNEYCLNLLTQKELGNDLTDYGRVLNNITLDDFNRFVAKIECTAIKNVIMLPESANP